MTIRTNQSRDGGGTWTKREGKDNGEREGEVEGATEEGKEWVGEQEGERLRETGEREEGGSVSGEERPGLCGMGNAGAVTARARVEGVSRLLDELETARSRGRGWLTERTSLPGVYGCESMRGCMHVYVYMYLAYVDGVQSIRGWQKSDRHL